MDVRTIPVKELYEQIKAGKSVDLIDVRTPAEFQEIHAEGAKLVPLDRLDPKAVMAERNGTAGAMLYVICRSGSRAKQACVKFLSAGHDNVVCVEGGTLAWEQAGLPVQRGKKAVSLERQVRIAAGLMVLLGAILGFFVHPYFIALSAFVGAGLVFAGVTDTCGMGMLLARMPWNQVCAATVPAPSSQKAACCPQ
jgi:rhodanese-related sulfurtransferase